MRLSPRTLFAAIATACALLLAAAIFYFQDHLGLEPCPMCILQRYAFIAIGVVSLAAAVHGPKPRALMAYAGLVVLFAIAGAGVALRHSYLQHFPPARESCGTDLEFLLNTFSLADAFPKIFAGTGSCSKADWKFLALSMPEWALAWFIAFAALAAWMALSGKPRR